jgi:RND family efflux transporter MFP subunit
MPNYILANPLKILFVCVYGFVQLLVFGISMAPAQKGRPATRVRVAEVTKMDMAPQVVLIGTAQPILTSVVATEIDGRVEEFRANEGDFVEKGSVLARLKDSLLRIEIKGAQASKAEAEAQLRRARADLKRSVNLLATETISDKKHTDDLAEVQSLEARVTKLEAEIESHQDAISKKTIIAPFTGFIIKEHTQIGEWVDTGGAIVTLADLSRIEVVVEVPERYIPQLVAGTRGRVQIDALNPQNFTGAIAAIIPVGDSAARTFPVKIGVDNPGFRIKGGMLCRVTLATGKPSSVLAVPKDAVVNLGQKHLLFVVKDGAAQPMPVELGNASDSMIEVRGQVQVGMQVVTRGNERLRPGQPVQIIK